MFCFQHIWSQLGEQLGILHQYGSSHIGHGLENFFDGLRNNLARCAIHWGFCWFRHLYSSGFAKPVKPVLPCYDWDCLVLPSDSRRATEALPVSLTSLNVSILTASQSIGGRGNLSELIILSVYSPLVANHFWCHWRTTLFSTNPSRSDWIAERSSPFSKSKLAVVLNILFKFREPRILISWQMAAGMGW